MSAPAILAALPLVALGLVGCGDERYVAPPARNVVLIVVDTLRADHVGIHGYARDTTPFLDRWAAERGVVFSAARATSPWTKPSVAALLTGLDARGTGILGHHDRLHADLRRLPTAFGEAGYQTAGVQSNALISSVFGYQAGFDVWRDERLATHDVSTGEDVHELAVHWLREERDPERPFFLYVHHYEPHFAYLRDGAEFTDEPYTGPLTGHEPMDQLIAATELLTDADVRYLAACYDAELRYQDELFERLVRELDDLGLGADTLVVFTADHGEEFLDHGELSHQHQLYDELLRVPLVFARPGEPAPGRRVPDSVSLVDLGRTLLDLCGLAETPFPGRSFAPLLDGAPVPPRAVFAQVRTLRPGSDPAVDLPRALDAVVAEGWKLVRDPETGACELYDLTRDPGELEDRFADEAARAAELERALDRWLESETGAPELGADRVEITPELTQRMKDLGYF